MCNTIIATHMLLYLMMDPTITAVPPKMATTEAMAAETLMSTVYSSESILHS